MINKMNHFGELCNSDDRVDGDCLMLFDLSVRGHHPNYIQQLIHYWSSNNVPGHLEIVVSPRFLEEHSDIVNLAKYLERSAEIQFTAITIQEEAALKSKNSFLSRNQRAYQELKLLRKYAEVISPTHCLLMYFDTYQIPLAMGYRLPCPISGIYFRPTFHYYEFPNQNISWKEKLQQWRERITLSKVLSYPHLRVLFCLDPFVVKYLQNHEKIKVVHLPDPVLIPQKNHIQSQTLKTRLGIETGRKVFLLFGALTERKGVYQLLDAVSLLPAELCKQLCLLFVGESGLIEILEARITVLCQQKPVQVIRHYEFVAEQDVPVYFNLADIVLAPYQRHVGMSGILLLAAAAQKPVLSSDYGLMGELVRRHGLGLIVDSTNPGKISQELTHLLLEPTADLCEPNQLQSFVEQNSAQRFAQVIFEHCSLSRERFDN